MKITILNGNPNSDNVKFERNLDNLSDLLKSDNHTVIILKLKKMDIKYCTGCWGCWVKNPGECVFADDSRNICREYINSDFVLFASPIIVGFTSALLKKANDKLLPLLLPYIEIVQNECHHLSRYDKYPETGLLLEKEKDTDDDDIKIISDIYMRDAINLKSELCFTKLIDDPVDEVVNEINNI